MTSRRILYAGDDNALAATLRDRLKYLNCNVVRAPVGVASTFIKSDINYSILLFDDTAEGVQLEGYARTIEHRAGTPVVRVKKAQGVNSLVDALARLLS